MDFLHKRIPCICENELQRHFNDHAMASINKLYKFLELVVEELGDEWHWNLNVEECLLSISNDSKSRDYAIQVLGTYSRATGCWLWAWANSSLSTKSTELAYKLHQLGESADVEILRAPQIEMPEQAAVRIAAVGAGLSESDALFSCHPEDDLEIFLSVAEPRMSSRLHDPASLVSSMMHYVDNDIGLDHLHAFLGFVRFLGLAPNAKPKVVEVTLDSGLTATEDGIEIEVPIGQRGHINAEFTEDNQFISARVHAPSAEAS